MKVLTNIIVFSVGGLLASITALIVLSIFTFFDNNTTILLLFSSIIEELIKLLFILIIINLLNINKLTKISPLFVVIFGIFFSFFEYILRILNNTLINHTFLYSTTIHILTSLLILLSIIAYRSKHGLLTIPFVFFVLALFVHICYNLVVLKFM